MAWYSILWKIWGHSKMYSQEHWWEKGATVRHMGWIIADATFQWDNTNIFLHILSVIHCSNHRKRYLTEGVKIPGIPVTIPSPEALDENWLTQCDLVRLSGTSPDTTSSEISVTESPPPCHTGIFRICQKWAEQAKNERCSAIGFSHSWCIWAAERTTSWSSEGATCQWTTATTHRAWHQCFHL
jgi:hypothetical protein